MSFQRYQYGHEFDPEDKKPESKAIVNKSGDRNGIIKKNKGSNAKEENNGTTDSVSSSRKNVKHNFILQSQGNFMNNEINCENTKKINSSDGLSKRISINTKEVDESIEKTQSNEKYRREERKAIENKDKQGYSSKSIYFDGNKGDNNGVPYASECDDTLSPSTKQINEFRKSQKENNYTILHQRSCVKSQTKRKKEKKAKEFAQDIVPVSVITLLFGALISGIILLFLQNNDYYQFLILLC